MLGKQGWRIINTPNSLIARLLKARYFKYGTFLCAKLGRNPSLVWRSIWSAQQILQQECRWRIGEGDNINLWIDSWLREAENFKLETSRPYSLATLKIEDLWIPNQKEWDVELLGQIVTERDANVIASIPLNLYNPVDELI